MYGGYAPAQFLGLGSGGGGGAQRAMHKRIVNNIIGKGRPDSCACIVPPPPPFFYGTVHSVRIIGNTKCLWLMRSILHWKVETIQQEFQL